MWRPLYHCPRKNSNSRTALFIRQDGAEVPPGQTRARPARNFSRRRSVPVFRKILERGLAPVGARMNRAALIAHQIQL